MVDLVPIFRKVVMGAAEASLDIAGAALLPGAWPILKRALEPVLDRLKKRLGDDDITNSPEQAERAVAAFEADQHLQEILRSRLLEQLDSLIKGGEKVEADVQKLMLIATGDQKLLNDLVGGIAQLGERLDKGVDLSDAAVDKLVQAVSRQAENSRQVRALALQEMGPVAQLVERQVHRLQVRAVELVQEGAVDRAADELQEGLLLIAALLNEAPTDISLRLELGFIYKTMSQVYDAAGHSELAQTYIQRAGEVFHFVRDGIAGDQKTTLDTANAIHGMGNVDHQRGNFKGAIEKYKLALQLDPDHVYAMHDIFAAGYELAKQGEGNLGEMREVLEKLKETGEGLPGLSSQKIEGFERLLCELEEREARRSEVEEAEDPPSPAGDPLLRAIPRSLVLVIAESDPYKAWFNLDCELINESSSRLSVRKLEAEATTPQGLKLPFKWNVFYASHPPKVPGGAVMMMTKTSDAHEIHLEAGKTTSLGIQFVDGTLTPQNPWAPGLYKFELSGSVLSQPEQDGFNVKTQFAVKIGPYEAVQVMNYCRATKADWDRLNDPDRAAGVRVQIEESSIRSWQAPRVQTESP